MSKSMKRTIIGLLAAGLTALGAYWGYEVKVSVVEIQPASAPITASLAAQ